MQFNSIEETFNWLLSINDSNKPGSLMIDGHAASLKELQDINFQAISFIKDYGVLRARRELKEVEDDPSALEKLNLTINQLIKIRDKGLDLGLKWNLLMLAEKKG